MPLAYRIDPRDNVAICLDNVKTGDIVRVNDDFQIIARDDIPIGHKIALQSIGLSEPIIKYGEVIGIASRKIASGEYVHIHNVKSIRLSRVDH